MIDKRLEKVISHIKSIYLTAEEKHEVKDRILLVIDKIEAVSMTGKTSFDRPVKSPFVANIVSYIEYKKFVPAFVIAGLLLLSGGVSLAAERALPGDSLFALKKVNEEVLGLAAVSPEAKARLALEVGERRLQEAATLSVQGKLTGERKALIQQEFKKQAAQVKNQVASLISQNNIIAAQEIVLDFESSLKAHEELIMKVTPEAIAIASTTGQSATVSSLLATIKDELATSTLARTNLQSKELAFVGNNAEKAELRLKELAAKVAEVKDLKNKMSETELAQVTLQVVSSKISEAEAALQKAHDYQSAHQYSDAILIAQQVDRAMSDAHSILLTEKNAHIAVKRVIETKLASTALSTSTISTSTASTTEATSTPASEASTSTASTTPAASSSSSTSAI